MEAALIIDNKRVAVQGPYDPELIKLYKSISKWFWSMEDHVWTFPVDAVPMLSDFLEKRNYKVCTIDRRPKARIWLNGLHCSVKLNGFFEDFKSLKSLAGFEYDQVNRICTFESSQLDALVKLFNEKKYAFEIVKD